MTTKGKSRFDEAPSLIEVWEMKDAAQKELEGKTWEEQKRILHQSMLDAANAIGATLIKLPNGNYKFG
jgi:hypothetical protein